MLTVKASASAVLCALPLIITTLIPPCRSPLVPLPVAPTNETFLLLLSVSRRRRSTGLLLPLKGAALMALPLPNTAAFDANVGTKAAARQAAVDSAAIVATAPLDNMRKRQHKLCSTPKGARGQPTISLGYALSRKLRPHRRGTVQVAPVCSCRPRNLLDQRSLQPQKIISNQAMVRYREPLAFVVRACAFVDRFNPAGAPTSGLPMWTNDPPRRQSTFVV